MIISNAQVQLQSQHQSLSTRLETLDFQIWKSSEPATTQPNVKIASHSLHSKPAQETQQVESLRKNLQLEISLLKRLIERLTGREMKFYTPESNDQSSASVQNDIPERANNNPNSGMTLQYSSSIHESETMSMTATAVINTSDGRQIHTELNISYSRELEIQQNFSLRAGQALKDPLVLNFSGTSLQLAAQSFNFDLDVNGELDQIPLFQSNSAFLALDKNQDGIINNGSELFGALSGDGFSELAQYDSDGNQWIDENDPVFAELRLMHVGSDGQQQLISLNEKGVGAIYLNKVATPFELRDSQQQNLQGAIKSSGLYLMESGEAGSMQQIDLAI